MNQHRAIRFLGCVAVVVTACGPSAQPPTAPESAAPPKVQAPVECPEDLALTVVFPVKLDPAKAPVWMVHERVVEAVGDDPFAAGQTSGAKMLAPPDAQRLGMQARDAEVWVFYRDEAPPCRMAATQAWAVRRGDGPSWTGLGWMLEGSCALPPEANAAHKLAFWAKGEPSACRMHAVGSIARDEQGVGTPVLPSEVKAVLPAVSCEGTQCFRWTWDGIGLTSGVAVYEVAAAWLHAPKGGEAQCAAPFDKFHGAFVRSGASAAWEPVPGAAGLAGVVYDGRGLRAVAADDGGVLSVWVPTGGVPGLRRAGETRHAKAGARSTAQALWPSCR